MFAVGLSYVLSMTLREDPFIANFIRVTMKEGWDLSEALTALIEMITRFIPFIQFMWYTIFNDLIMLILLFIPEMSPNWSW